MACEHRLNHCGKQAQLLCGLWDHLGSGLEPVSSVLEVGFLIIEPPAMPQRNLVLKGTFLLGKEGDMSSMVTRKSDLLEVNEK